MKDTVENKAIWISAGILYTMVLALIFTQIGFIQGKKIGAYQGKVPQEIKTVTVDEESLSELPIVSSSPIPYKFIVKRYGDAIAVYEDDVLIRTIDDIDFNNLRKEDRNKLEQGIEATSPEDLASILEDYIS